MATEEVVGDGCGNANAPGLEGLLSWFAEHRGSVPNLCLEDLGGEMGLSLFTRQALSKGDTVMSIPISLCMTIKSAAASELGVVLEATPHLMDTPDEILALHLMVERRKRDGSFWKEYLRFISLLPTNLTAANPLAVSTATLGERSVQLTDDVDTPLRWLVEGAEEDFRLLDGTMVGLLSRMMHSQVVKDWEEVHLPLVETHPEVLGGVTFEDYLWAMSSIWSRSFDYQEPTPDGSSVSRRAMVPVINAANHDPSAADSLSEMIEMIEVGVSVGAGDETRGGGTLRVTAGRDYAAREQFFILYGRYSNAKLLYSYGFVLASNPYCGLDYWVRVPATDPDFQWKQALLDDHRLTAAQAYDFSGTLRAGGWISPALLATVRVAQLTTEERTAAEHAFQGKIVSPRNEAASLGALLAGLRRKLASLGGGTAGQSAPGTGNEEEVIAALEVKLERQQRHRQPNREKEESEGGEEGRAEADPAVNTASRDSALPVACAEKSLRRKISAARVRLEEKVVVADAIAALEASFRELQSAVSLGVGGVASFVTLDGRG